MAEDLSTARQREKWRKRMCTIQRKAQQLTDDIQATEGESELWRAASDVAVMAFEGVHNFGGFDPLGRTEGSQGAAK